MDIQTLNDGTKKVLYDVAMSPKLTVEEAVIDKLTGLYTGEKDKANKMVFFKKDKLLWRKNQVFGDVLEYLGNNTFQYPNAPQGRSLDLSFRNDAFKCHKDHRNTDRAKRNKIYQCGNKEQTVKAMQIIVSLQNSVTMRCHRFNGKIRNPTLTSKPANAGKPFFPL